MVFPEAFHLGWLGATRRLFHLAESFARLGFDVVLLARRMGDPRLQQQIDIEFPGQVLRTRHTGDYPIVFDGKPFLERAWRMGWKMRGQDLYWSRLSWGWVDRLDTGGSAENFRHAVQRLCLFGESVEVTLKGGQQPIALRKKWRSRGCSSCRTRRAELAWARTRGRSCVCSGICCQPPTPWW